MSSSAESTQLERGKNNPDPSFLEGCIKASDMPKSNIDTSSLIHVDVRNPPAASNTNSDPPTSPKIVKPTKRSTVVELRKSLEALGLDIVGKKESLYKRLLKAFYRTSEPDPQLSSTDEPEEKASEEDKTFENWQERAQNEWQSFLCFDVEATCRGGKEFDWPNEIIEFPVVLLKWSESHLEATSSVEATAEGDSEADDGKVSPIKRKLVKVDTFHSYVRPVWQPKLTDFCTSLTGITQETVDKSPTFPEMLKLLEVWLDKHDLRDEDNRLKHAVWVTDGPWDLRDFVPKQLFITPVKPHPTYLFGQYLNIKQATQTVLSELWRANHHSSPQPSISDSEKPSVASPSKKQNGRHDFTSPNKVITTHKTMTKAFREGNWKGPNFYHNIAGQVAALDLGEFEGRQHSGLDDAINISRILVALSEKENVVIEPNARTPHENHMKKWPWMGKDGKVQFEEWMSRGSGVDLKVNKSTVTGGETTANGEKKDKMDDTAENGVEPLVVDMRRDGMGNIRAVKVPLSQASEATQKFHAERIASVKAENK